MRILVTSFMRLTSERIHQKLLATVDGSSLAEIAISKLARLATMLDGRYDTRSAICVRDGPLAEIARRHECPILDRSSSSRDAEDAAGIYGELREPIRRQGFQRLVVINPCLPFLRLATIVGFLEGEPDLGPRAASRMAVTEQRGWIWDDQFHRLYGKGTLNTKTNRQYYLPCHALNSFPVAALGTDAQSDFRHFVVLPPGPELIDIDTPEDLEFARSYAAGVKARYTNIDWIG